MTAAFRILLALAVLAVTLMETRSAHGQEDRWVFRVLMNDKEIGYHEFRVLGPKENRRVEINADFDVKVLFINAYSYDHENTEFWTGNCLAGIDSFTNDNGAEFLVKGERTADSFVVSTQEDKARISAECVQTFAYWNPAILDSNRLLNSQTGEFIEVNVVDGGPDTLELGPNRIAARKYTIEMKDGPIRLWYSPDTDRWLALEAPAKGGRTIRYEPLVLPVGAVGDPRLAMD